MSELFAVAETSRSVDELTTAALSVIDDGFAAGAERMLPLFSGGHDSLCVCHVASQHPRFTGEVHHIDTGIGAKSTRRFVEEVCKEFDWKLRVWKSPKTYQFYVEKCGFPGPGGHRFIYQWLKERCVRQMGAATKPDRLLLLTGARVAESTRRMGHTKAAIVVGERSMRTGKVTNKRRVWCSPAREWSNDEQREYMDAHDLPRNPLKLRLGMSGECFCGAFASPGELERIRTHAPDVAAEIDRLTIIAKECGTPCEWGTRPEKNKGLVIAKTGPMCSSCDRRAYAAGLLFEDDAA